MEKFIDRQAIIDVLKLADRELENPNTKYSSVEEVLLRIDKQKAIRAFDHVKNMNG